MDPRDLKRILEALTEADVREFNLKTSEYELAIKRGAETVVVSTPVAAPAPVQAAAVQTAPVAQAQPATAPAQAPAAQAPAAEAAAPEVKGVTVKAPIVGTFYTAPSPDSPPYVQVGDRVEAGQVLCIIEAMKLMNEIEAETAGVIRKIFVSNASPVEYGQDLFLIEP
ncbi:acetyl-CoA carboxylase biotin carboxyl carrier protein [Deinobacterium chartae]|nr:acetyl-CoA carboxylase biotin carboxyl carrier protein [Deinobacterium chartae]